MPTLGQGLHASAADAALGNEASGSAHQVRSPTLLVGHVVDEGPHVPVLAGSRGCPLRFDHFVDTLPETGDGAGEHVDQISHVQR